MPGSGSFGAFDPSVAQDPSTGRLWMSYSAVGDSPNSLWGVSVQLAYSDDGGRHWTNQAMLDPARDVMVGPLTVTAPEPAITAGSSGTWQSETSTLVHDPHPGAPANERWKLLWHQVLWAGNFPYFVSYSWIAMKTAATPEGLAAATAVKLFGGTLLKSDGESTSAPAMAPIGGAPAIALNTRDAELANCVFGEPGMLAANDAIYLALDCQSLGNPVQTYTVMFRCASPCAMTNASAWNYLGRVATPADAQIVDSGYKSLSAPAFLIRSDKTYLSLTPVEPAAGGDRYDGCRVYEFQDLATGLLRRDMSGRLLPPAVQVTGVAGSHHGACAYHASLDNGILLSQLVSSTPPYDFAIYSSHVSPP